MDSTQHRGPNYGRTSQRSSIDAGKGPACNNCNRRSRNLQDKQLGSPVRPIPFCQKDVPSCVITLRHDGGGVMIVVNGIGYDEIAAAVLCVVEVIVFVPIAQGKILCEV